MATETESSVRVRNPRTRQWVDRAVPVPISPGTCAASGCRRPSVVQSRYCADHREVSNNPAEHQSAWKDRVRRERRFVDEVFDGLRLERERQLFEHKAFIRCTFINSNFDSCSFQESSFVDCRFYGCTFSNGCNLDWCQFTGCEFVFARIIRCSCASARLIDCKAEESIISRLSIDRGSMSGVVFAGCDLLKSDFRWTSLVGIHIAEGSSLSGLRLRQSQLEELEVRAPGGGTLDPAQVSVALTELGVEIDFTTQVAADQVGSPADSLAPVRLLSRVVLGAVGVGILTGVVFFAITTAIGVPKPSLAIVVGSFVGILVFLACVPAYERLVRPNLRPSGVA